MSESLTLLYQSHSPYARKVLVSAHELGLADRIDVVHHETSPTNRNDAVFAANPLGKVPVLLTPDAGALFDSVVICDYLDRLGGTGRLIPREGRRAMRRCVCRHWLRGSAMQASRCAGRRCGARKPCAIRPWRMDRH